MHPLQIKDLAGTFCELNEINQLALLEIAVLDIIKRNIVNTKNLYISSDFKINKTTLTADELKKLNLREIELVQGFWYYKSDLEGKE